MKMLIVNHAEATATLFAEFVHHFLGIDALGVWIDKKGTTLEWEPVGSWNPARKNDVDSLHMAAYEADVVLIGSSETLDALAFIWGQSGITAGKRVIGISSDHQPHLKERIPLIDLVRMGPDGLKKFLGL